MTARKEAGQPCWSDFQNASRLGLDQKPRFNALYGLPERKNLPLSASGCVQAGNGFPGPGRRAARPGNRPDYAFSGVIPRRRGFPRARGRGGGSARYTAFYHVISQAHSDRDIQKRSMTHALGIKRYGIALDIPADVQFRTAVISDVDNWIAPSEASAKYPSISLAVPVPACTPRRRIGR